MFHITKIRTKSLVYNKVLLNKIKFTLKQANYIIWEYISNKPKAFR